MLTITINEKDLDKLGCIGEATRKAAYRTLAKTERTVVNEWAREINKQLVLPMNVIKSSKYSVFDTKINLQGNTASLDISLRSSKGLPLKLFKPIKNERGVSVHIKRKGGRQTAKSAFMYNSHVWRRQQQGGHLVKRLPIEKLYTTDTEDIAKDVLPQMEKIAEKRVNQVFTRQLSFELSQRCR